MKPNSIFTTLGNYVSLTEATPADIHIVDIAHALSQICRFGGHTRQFYSVAQHSVGVADLLPKELKLYGLLHDSGEAYLGDMVQPLKCMPHNSENRELEVGMLAKIHIAFGLDPYPSSAAAAAIHEADLVMLATERRDLLAPDSAPWPALAGVSARRAPITPKLPLSAEAEFLRRFKEVTGQL